MESDGMESEDIEAEEIEAEGGLERECDHCFKVLLVGDEKAGKTCLLKRYTDGVFSESYVRTVGVDFAAREFETDGKLIRLNIWDMAGDGRFKSMTDKFYRGTNGILMVFDITDMESFQKIQKIISDEGNLIRRNVSKLLIGTKCDMEYKRQVPSEMAQEFANQLNIPYLETSAKYGTNVEDAFLQLTSAMMKV